MDPGGEQEIPLLGGDVTEGLVRVGDTVRRPPAQHSAAVAAYLHALEAAGFAEAPRHLGIDDHGRDVLTFLPGETAGRPLHAWAAAPEVLEQIATMQRRLHDAVPVDLELPAGVTFPVPVQLPDVPPAYDVADVIGHNDLTPDNLIFDANHRLVGVIDFDMAGPNERVRDVVTTLLHWAPLRDPVDRDPGLRDVDAGARMRMYAAAYGLDPEQRSRLYDVAVRRQQRSWHAMKHNAETLGGGWARMWDEGVGDLILRSQRWLADHEDELRRALGPVQESAEGFAVYDPGAARLPAPEGLVVREAVAADVEACVAIIVAVNGGGDEYSWRMMFRRVLGDDDQRLFVADVGGEVVGYGRVSHREARGNDVTGAPAGYYLMGLAIAECWRRRGLAEALTEARLAWAWSRTDRVWYFASAQNTVSLALHRRLGFREVTHGFEAPGLDFAGGVGVLSVCERPAGHPGAGRST